MKKQGIILCLLMILSITLVGCNRHVNGRGESPKGLLEQFMKRGSDKPTSGSGEFEISEEELYKILEESGYGEDIDWANKTDDDPSVPKSMDVTTSVEDIKNAYHKLDPKALDAGDDYEKDWWDYIPSSYDLTQDIFPKTDSFAGAEKQYNNSLEQSILECYNGYTTGQAHDVDTAKIIANTFIYEEKKNQYKWTANLDNLCEVAKGFNIADFRSKECMVPLKNKDGSLMCPGFMNAYFDTSVVGYNKIGIPQFGGYSFTITVWEDKNELVGWVNELEGGAFINEEEIYENMGEWDFYDELNAIDNPTKVVKPKVPNGVIMYNRSSNKLSKEQYVYKKIPGAGGSIYYYGNGISVDMTFYDGGQGGKFEDALDYCRVICGNK